MEFIRANSAENCGTEMHQEFGQRHWLVVAQVAEHRMTNLKLLGSNRLVASLGGSVVKKLHCNEWKHSF